MRTVRLWRGRILVLSLLLCLHAPLIGCNDDSKTSGTQVAENPEAVVYRKSKAAAYRGGPPRKQAKANFKKNQ
jgi:hypothetical protein